MRRITTQPRCAAAFVVSATILLAAAPAALAADVTVGNGQTVGDQDIAGTDTLTVEAGGTIEDGSDAVQWDGPSAAPGLTIDNSGTIRSTGARGIDTSNGNTTRNIDFDNNAGALLEGDGDAFRIDTDAVGSTVDIDNAGTIQSLTGQALDFDEISSAAAGATTITNQAGGLIRAAEADAVRPGQGAIVDNAGTICVGAFSGSGCGDAVADENHDGVDWQDKTGTLINRATGIIEGGRHGTTADVDIDVTNEAGGLIVGKNGSGVGSDGNGTVVNHGTIRGQWDGYSANGDGDGVDIDDFADITNSGTIEGLSAAGFGSDGGANSADGIAIGGGIVDNQTGGTIFGGANGILVDDSSLGGAPHATVLTNAGAITGASGYGVRLVGTQNDLVTSTGSIAGGTVALDLGGGDDMLTLDTGATMSGLTDGGDGFDTLKVLGTVSLGDAVNFEALMLGAAGALSLLGDLDFLEVVGLDIAAGSVLNLMGAFDVTYKASAAANAYLGGVSYALQGGGTLRAVPEPASLALLGLGLAGLGVALRRRKG